MTDDEYKVCKNMLDKDTAMVKVGYNRFKEKLKIVRQYY